MRGPLEANVPCHVPSFGETLVVVELLDVVELVLLVVDDVTDVVAGLVEGGTFENEFWALESTQDGKFPSGTQSIALF